MMDVLWISNLIVNYHLLYINHFTSLNILKLILYIIKLLIENNIDLSDFKKWANPEWEITYTNVTRHEQHYPCCTEPYPDVTFYMKIKRRASLYCTTVFIPSFVAILLGLISFWYPLRSTSRIILNVMSILILIYLLIYIGFKLGFSTNTTPKSGKSILLYK
jgi:nicotinic acetylcholine receptor, invertebrate